MMMRWRAMIVAMCLAALPLGCIGTPGNAANTLSYNLPTTLNIPLGEAIPGTDIVFAAYTEQGARFLIEGQSALKRVGDSLRWSGEQVPGTQVELKLRLAHANETSARLIGTAKIVVSDTAPTSDPPNTTGALQYTGPVAYGVTTGSRLPGTTLSYVGPTDEGAQLAGLDEYPYRLVGDSIYWEGRLNEHASLRLEVRVAQYDERKLRVAGLATLWLY